MTISFSRTVRTVRRDRFHHSGWFLSLCSLMALIAVVWVVRGRVPIYVRSDSARLEADRAIFHLQPRVAGQVVENLMEIGQRVEKGEVLVRLDGRDIELASQRVAAEIESLGRALAALEEEIGARQGRIEETQELSRLVLAESASELKTAAIVREDSEEESATLKRLNQSGLYPDRDYSKIKADSERRKSEEETVRLGARRKEAEYDVEIAETQALIAELKRERATVEGALVEAKLKREDQIYQLEKRLIRAPAAGVVAEVELIPPGAVVAPETHLGSILSEGEIQVVGWFLPDQAFGRVRPDQQGFVRFSGYPWNTYRVLACRVKRMAEELQSGRARVLLDLGIPADDLPKLRHGIPCSVKIEISRVTPLELLMGRIRSNIEDLEQAGDP